MIWINEHNSVIARVGRGNPRITDSSVRVNISTSKKNMDETYKYSNWQAVFFKDNMNIAKNLKEGDKIRILSGGVEVSEYQKDGIYYKVPTVLVWKFEIYVTQNAKQVRDDTIQITNGKDIINDLDDLPF